MRDEGRVLPAKDLQDAQHRHDADVELHRRQQRAGAGGGGFIGHRQPAVDRRQPQLAAQAEQHQRQAQAPPAGVVAGQRGGHAVEVEVDHGALQLGCARQAQDAQQRDQQRHAGVQQVLPRDAPWRLCLALRHQRRSAEGGQFDEGPQQQQVVGHHPQVHRHHEGEGQPGAGQQVARQHLGRADARRHVHADAQEHRVDDQQEQHRRGVEHETAVQAVQRQLGQRHAHEHGEGAQHAQHGSRHQRRAQPQAGRRRRRQRRVHLRVGRWWLPHRHRSTSCGPSRGSAAATGPPSGAPISQAPTPMVSR